MTITPITNLRGPAAAITGATAVHVPADQPLKVITNGTPQNRQFTFEIPQAIPGTGAVPADTAVGAYVLADGTETGAAVATRIQREAAIVNVKAFGAIPGDMNGGEGATVAIQAAIDAVEVAGGGDVIVDDDYWIKAHDPNAPAGNFLGDYGGIAMKDGVHLRMTDSGVLRAIPNGERRYVIVRIYNKRDVRVSGGRVIGERPAHTGTTGEWGYNIAITGGENITIENLTTSDAWGDGINIQRLIPTPGVIVPPKTIRVRNVISTGNRRQGLSLEAGDDVQIEDSVFKDTGGVGGVLPMNGIDVEPVDNVTPCVNVSIRRCRFENNSGFGCSVYMLGTRDVIVDDCDFVDSRGAHQFVANLAGPNVRLSRSRFSGTVTQCVQISGGTGRVVTDNVFDSKVRIAHNTASNVARNVMIARNRFVVNSVVRIDGLVEINEHARFTDVLDNHFENVGARGSGIWGRIVGPGGALAQIRIRGNTFVNMSAAVTAGAVAGLDIAHNGIHACGGAAITLLPATNAKITDNRITGSNLVTGTAAIQLGSGAIDTLVSDNLIEVEPAVTVPETRRGTKAIQLDWGPTTNTVVRGTLTRGALSTYDQLPAVHPSTYLETTPGSWFTW